nr:hypothetical protein [uncultured Niameybacter sp.]
MSHFNFTVSYLDSNGEKHDKQVCLDSVDYAKHCEKNYSVLMQNYPPDQAEKHILATKKTYIQETIANQFSEHTPLKYDITEMINTLDTDIKVGQ